MTRFICWIVRHPRTVLYYETDGDRTRLVFRCDCGKNRINGQWLTA